MREFFITANSLEVALAGIAFFLSIYIVFGLLNEAATRWLFPSLNIGKRLSNKTPQAAQYRREFTHSVISIVIFGVGVLIPWGLLQLGWVDLAKDPSAMQICMEIGALTLWNELHFYVNHRLLHTPWLRRFHTSHHRSVITTPWTCYSLHPIEAMMVGNVIIWPMLVHDFSVHALVALPMISLVFNNTSHANYDFGFSRFGLLSKSSLRHNAHHTLYNGNYGFMFGFMDKAFGTQIEAEK